MEVQKDFLELLRLLNAHGVEYLVVGGYAVAFHGAPRFTGAIDIFVAPEGTNVEKVLIALGQFGFPTLGLSPDEVIAGKKILQLGREPFQVHVMTAVSGIAWDEAWESRTGGHYGPCPVYFIGRQALIRNKRSTGRAKDQADVEALEE
jgi:hypothetical protein